MTRFVAVIDLGKTNSKVALVDTAEAIELQVVTEPAAVDNTGIYTSLDHKRIEAFVVRSLASIAADHPIDAITVTTHGATVALVDESGDLAMPVLDYEYQEIDSTRCEYNKVRPHFSDTGSPALPAGLNIGAQLYWQQSSYPKQFASVNTVLTWPQYWVYFLTGERHNDVTSLGCHSDLYEPRMQRHSSLIADMGWQALMPPVKNSGQYSGLLTESLAKQLGLSKPIPVHIGIHDSNASLVPHLLTQDAPFSVVSTGTWFIAMAIGAKQTELDESRDTLLNINANGECVPSARFMGGRERDLLRPSVKTSDHGLDELLRIDSSSNMLMPSIVSGTGPFPNATAQWLGNETDLDYAVRDSAIALYLALMTHESMCLIGCTGPTFIEGPLAHDQQFAQMLAVVTGRNVYSSTAQTGTSVGAAMLINTPDKPPVYEMVELSANRRDELAHYAKSWQQHLHNHTK